MKMKKYSLTAVAVMLVAVSSFFVLMGSYLFINRPTIPEEMRKGGE